MPSNRTSIVLVCNVQFNQAAACSSASSQQQTSEYEKKRAGAAAEGACVFICRVLFSTALDNMYSEVSMVIQQPIVWNKPNGIFVNEK